MHNFVCCQILHALCDLETYSLKMCPCFQCLYILCIHRSELDDVGMQYNIICEKSYKVNHALLGFLVEILPCFV